ncbi:hypothetical protein ACH470_03105 [Streptomyces bottropensis]|uniref:hypothetical protein n=1 Tax=Streptomyces bottropensis TaxID=42235 RepID=UPI003790AAF8
MTNNVAMQAAVVTMLVAKRPALAKLPIRWELRANGEVTVSADLGADGSLVPQIAAELARAMRGPRTESYDLTDDDGTITRAFEVEARVSGIQVKFYGYQRGLQSAEASTVVEGGEGK